MLTADNAHKQADVKNDVDGTQRLRRIYKLIEDASKNGQYSTTADSLPDLVEKHLINNGYILKKAQIDDHKEPYYITTISW
jgi:hypothetical protein